MKTIVLEISVQVPDSYDENLSLEDGLYKFCEEHFGDEAPWDGPVPDGVRTLQQIETMADEGEIYIENLVFGSVCK